MIELEGSSGHRRVTTVRKHFPVAGIANDNPVLRVVKREPLGYRLDRFGQRLLHRTSLNDIFSKDLDGVDHSADLVTTVAMADIDIDLAD